MEELETRKEVGERRMHERMGEMGRSMTKEQNVKASDKAPGKASETRGKGQAECKWSETRDKRQEARNKGAKGGRGARDKGEE